MWRTIEYVAECRFLPVENFKKYCEANANAHHIVGGCVSTWDVDNLVKEFKLYQEKLGLPSRII